MAYFLDNDPQKYLEQWVESTANIIGAVMVKKKVQFSETDRENISISLSKKASHIYEITIRSRESLRFVDMGAGNGFHKGVPTSTRKPQKAVRKNSAHVSLLGNSTRKPKKILTKPLFGRLNDLQSVLLAYITEVAEFKTEKFLNLIENGN
jgi:hypothetical protein